MLAISFRFPAGFYHATPWGRHVNEGEVEWPPSPWRVLRALQATWFLKGDINDKASNGSVNSVGFLNLKALIHDLAASLPVYHLPLVTRGHTRHYMPGASSTSLVFDAFIKFDPDAGLIMAWPELTLNKTQEELLDLLLDRMGYLGRSESWVEATRLEKWQETPNCFPVEAAEIYAEISQTEPIQVMCVQKEADFAVWRQGALEGMAVMNRTKGSRRSRMSLPESVFESLLADTSDLEKSGWNQPPGSRWVNYLRPYPSFGGKAFVPTSKTQDKEVNIARFAISGKPLPLVLESVSFGELFRRALLHWSGPDSPSIISGRDENNQVLEDGHRHAFFLPEDADGDGRIDHLVIYSSVPFPKELVVALPRLRKLWTSDRSREWAVYLEGTGLTLNSSDRKLDFSPLLSRAHVWKSVTPYLHPWFMKKNGRFGAIEQLEKEIILRGLPKPIQIIEEPLVRSGGRPLSALQFRRFRSNNGQSQKQPDRHGSFYKVIFAEPVSGPLAFGYGCHFGLGMFTPVE